MEVGGGNGLTAPSSEKNGSEPESTPSGAPSSTNYLESNGAGDSMDVEKKKIVPAPAGEVPEGDSKPSSTKSEEENDQQDEPSGTGDACPPKAGETKLLEEPEAPKSALTNSEDRALVDEPKNLDAPMDTRSDGGSGIQGKGKNGEEIDSESAKPKDPHVGKNVQRTKVLQTGQIYPLQGKIQSYQEPVGRLPPRWRVQWDSSGTTVLSEEWVVSDMQEAANGEVPVDPIILSRICSCMRHWKMLFRQTCKTISRMRRQRQCPVAGNHIPRCTTPTARQLTCSHRQQRTQPRAVAVSMDRYS